MGLWILYYIAALILLVFQLWHQSTRLYKLGSKIPGPGFSLPIFGHALMALGKNPEDLVIKAFEYSAKFGDVVKGWLGVNLYIFLSDPEDVEPILNSHIHIDKSNEYRFFKPWLGDGLLISTGDKWRSHRKMIAPTFHINILKKFINVFNKSSLDVVEKMKCETGRTFDVHEYMGGVTVDILLQTVMGIERNSPQDSGSDYAAAVMKMCDIVHQRHYKFWLRLDSLFQFSSVRKQQIKLLNIIHGLTNKVIKIRKGKFLKDKADGYVPPTLEELTRDPITDQTILSRNEETLADTVFKGYRDDLDFINESDVGEKKRLAFLDLMVETTQEGTNIMSDQEIKEEVDTIMFEGHDTTAAGSSFFMCLLGLYQDVQDKCYNELYDIFGNSDRPATFEDTLEMKYLERVLFETLRLYPPVPVIARKLKHDVQITSKNYVLPAGATVVIGTMKIQRHEKYYKNPNVFDPDNFLPENTQNRHYYSFIPFSAGPRSCVGRKYALLKLKILLSTILRNYKIISDITEDQFQLRGDIILKRSDGFRIQIEPRKRVRNVGI